MPFTDMDKPSLAKDMLKITYKIKPKAMRSTEKEEEEPEEEMGGGEISSKLREAADLVDEGSYEEAMGLIEEAADMCSEMHGSDEESDMD